MDAILEAARQAPSARNRQPWHFVVVQDGLRRAELAALCLGQLWLATASVMLVGVALPKVSKSWCVVDTTIAMQNAVLAATALGYGTCWIGAFSQAGVKALLGISDEAQVVALLSIGVPAQDPDPRQRKPMSEIVSWERYGEHRDGSDKG